MKTFFGAIGGFFDVLPGWIWAMLVASMLVYSGTQGYVIAGLKVEAATAQTDKANAEAALSNRIAAEAVTIAIEVTKARGEERVKQENQEEKINELHKQNAAAAADLDGARQRVRVTIYGPTTRPSSPDLPQGAGLALGVKDPAGTELQAADRDFADRLLQLTTLADEVTRERNTCTALHP